jgi:hypothetical protein
MYKKEDSGMHNLHSCNHHKMNQMFSQFLSLVVGSEKMETNCIISFVSFSVIPEVYEDINITRLDAPTPTPSSSRYDIF